MSVRARLVCSEPANPGLAGSLHSNMYSLLLAVTFELFALSLCCSSVHMCEQRRNQRCTKSPNVVYKEAFLISFNNFSFSCTVSHGNMLTLENVIKLALFQKCRLLIDLIIPLTGRVRDQDTKKSRIWLHYIAAQILLHLDPPAVSVCLLAYDSQNVSLLLF